MKRIAMWMMLVMAVLGLTTVSFGADAVGVPAAPAGKTPAADAAKTPAATPMPGQTKTGEVKKVDVAAKQVVVMVTRELTFTVTDATKIVQGDAAKKLEDIKVGAKVSVDYTNDGKQNRTATKIQILEGKAAK